MAESDMMAFFLEDVLDMLQTWESECLALEKDSSNPNFNELFRIAHNIKGSSKMVDLGKFGEFIHRVEDVIDLLRKKQIEFIPAHIELFLDIHSFVESWLEGLSRDKSHVPVDESLEKRIKEIKQSVGKKSDQENTTLPTNSTEEKTKHPINENKKDNEQIKGDQLMDIIIDTSLTIANMSQIMRDVKIKKGVQYNLIVQSEVIDTSGAQYLISLKKTKDLNIQIKIKQREVIATLEKLGLEGMVL